MKQPEPILVADLFPHVRQELVALLRSLAPGDWKKKTVCASWSVKDVAAHLFGGDVYILSRRRDGYEPETRPISGYRDFVAFINETNADWIKATRRISPGLLCELLSLTGPQVEAYFSSLDPFALGEPVDWAGPEAASFWLDLAREYTERWHHQQQIRDAVGRPGLKERRYFAPVLDTFVRALPRTFREVSAGEETTVQLSIRGESGGDWYLVRTGGKWNLCLEPGAALAARVAIDQEDAWRLFTKGLSPDVVRSRAAFEGDPALGAKVLEMVSVLA